MPKLNFIYLALARWDGPYASTAWAIAQELAAKHNVYYVENPYTLKDVIFGLSKKNIRRRLPALLLGIRKYHAPFKDKNLIVVTPLVTLPINWLSNNALYRLLNKINNRLVFKAIKSSIKKFGLKEYVSFNSFNPFYGPYFPKKFTPNLNIYQSVDAIEQSEYLEKHGPFWEKKYVEAADFSITTSTKLKEKLKGYNNNVYLIPNAADIDLFKRARTERYPIPSELEGIPPKQKIIGYIGNICHRIDYDLLIALAKKYKEHKLVFIGPQKAKNEKVEELKSLYNTIFTGSKPLDQLPAYLQNFDCGLIPFLSNKLTASIYPLKINEYLAAGTPVVSTSFSPDIQDFKSVIHLSMTQEDFIHNVEVAIETPTAEWKEESLNFVVHNNWTNRADQLLELINKQAQNGQ